MNKYLIVFTPQLFLNNLHLFEILILFEITIWRFLMPTFLKGLPGSRVDAELGPKLYNTPIGHSLFKKWSKMKIYKNRSNREK